MNDFFLSIFQRTLHKNLLWFSNNEAVINKGLYSQVKEAALLLLIMFTAILFTRLFAWIA